MTGSADFSLFGLRVRSNRAFRDLPLARGDGDADVTIRFGDLPGDWPTDDGLYDYGDDGLFLVVEDTARFAIRDGRSIIVESAPGVSADTVRIYLFGTAFGLLLQQRGLLALHANAIVVGGSAVAFMGRSGAGKSTLAAWFHDHGHAILSDDICVVRRGPGGSSLVEPGIARMRLWKDAVEASGRDTSCYALSFTDDLNREKYDVPLDPGRIGGGAKPLTALYVLETGDRLAIDPIVGVDAADALFANTYRGEHLAAASARRHFQSCLNLVADVPIFRLRRPLGLDRLSDDVGRLVDHVRRIGQAG